MKNETRLSQIMVAEFIRGTGNYTIEQIIEQEEKENSQWFTIGLITGCVLSNICYLILITIF